MTHAALADILVEHPMSQPIPNSAYESILSVAHRLSSTSDLAEVLAMIIDALRDLLAAERASVFQYDEEADEFFATKARTACPPISVSKATPDSSARRAVAARSSTPTMPTPTRASIRP